MSFVDAVTEERQPPRKKLLIIDDDKQQLNEFSKEMAMRGYEVIPLHIAPDMLLGMVYSALVEHKPDAVLTDFQLNLHLKGTAIGQKMVRMCDTANLPKIPVILHTSADETVDLEGEKMKAEHDLLGVFKKSHGLWPVDELLQDYWSRQSAKGAARDGR